MVRKRSCPAVSHSCSLTILSSSSMVLSLCVQAKRGNVRLRSLRFVLLEQGSNATIVSTYKVHSNGGNMRSLKPIAGKTVKQARLADGHVPDQDEFENVIAVGKRSETVRNTRLHWYINEISPLPGASGRINISSNYSLLVVHGVDESLGCC